MALFDLTGIGGVTDVLKELIQLFPNAEQRAAAANKIQDVELAIAQGQMQINTEEAKNDNAWVSGWRPAVGWICVAGFAYTIIQPVCHLPVADTSTMTTMLMGMLGLGGMRSYEKIAVAKAKR